MARPKLIKLRKQAGLSQRELADMIPIDPSTYSWVEGGISQLSEKVMLRLKEIFSCTLEDIVEDVSSVHIENNGHLQNGYNQNCDVHCAPEWIATLLEKMDAQQQRHEAQISSIVSGFLDSLKSQQR